MTKHQARALAATLAGFALLALAIVYWTQRAGALPSIAPGYRAGSHKTDFALGFAVAAVAGVCFVAAWIESVRETSRS